MPTVEHAERLTILVRDRRKQALIAPPPTISRKAHSQIHSADALVCDRIAARATQHRSRTRLHADVVDLL
jgi:hypothetical protein